MAGPPNNPSTSEAGASARPARAGAPGHGRIVWDLAWPAIALNLLQTVNSLLDAKFIGMVGKDSLAASGAGINVLFLVMSLGLALATGATALVSRFYGADEPVNLIKANRQCTTLALILGIGLAGLGVLGTPAAARLFAGQDETVYREIVRYLYPVMAGVPAFFLFNSVAASLRAIGNTKLPMYVSGAAILVHILFNYLLMFPPHDVNLFGASLRVPGADMGIAGAGWALTISLWFSAAVYFPAAGRTVLGAVWRLQWPSIPWARRILRIATPAAVASIIRVASLGAFMAALKYTSEGTDALAAMRVGFAMEGIAFMPAFGYMIAASALVGQSLGMRDPHRAEKLAWSATSQAALIMAVMSVFFLLFAPQMAAFFVEDPSQRHIAILYLRIIAVTEPLFGYAMVLTGAHQGAGDTLRPTVVSFVSSWLIRVPAVWLFAVALGGDSVAAWWVMSATQAVNGALMIRLFRQGKWKEKEV